MTFIHHAKVDPRESQASWSESCCKKGSTFIHTFEQQALLTTTTKSSKEAASKKHRKLLSALLCSHAVCEPASSSRRSQPQAAGSHSSLIITGKSQGGSEVRESTVPICIQPQHQHLGHLLLLFFSVCSFSCLFQLQAAALRRVSSIQETSHHCFSIYLMRHEQAIV